MKIRTGRTDIRRLIAITMIIMSEGEKSTSSNDVVNGHV